MHVADHWHQVPEHGAEALARAGAWFGASLDANVTSFLGRAGVLASKLGVDVSRFQIQYCYFPTRSLATVPINGRVILKALFGITPIDEHELVWHGTLALKKTDRIWLDIINYLVFGLPSKVSAVRDIPLWNTMDPDGGRFFTRHDQGVLKFRAFYRSWVDKVAPEYAKHRFPMASNRHAPSRSSSGAHGHRGGRRTPTDGSD